MKPQPNDQCRFWRSDQFFNIDMARYSLSDHSFPRHFHNYYVIELVLSGADSFYCNGANYTATAGHVALINPGEVHTGSTLPGHGLQYYSMYPDVMMLHTIAEILEIKSPVNIEFTQTLIANPALTKQLASLFGILEKNAASDSHTTDPLLLEEVFFRSMYLLFSNVATTDSKKLSATGKDQRISTVIDYMRSNFRNNISLQQLAALICINPYHLIRIFKSSTGISPYDYLVNLRIDYAKTLLRKNYPVAEAASKAGFYDASHFNRLFKKTVGTTPKYFRQS